MEDPNLPTAPDAPLEPVPVRMSFVSFYRARYPAMVRLAVAITGSEAAAEDIVQDAFVRVHSHWVRVESPAAYLRVAVVNGCRSAHRRRKREQRVASSRSAEVAHLHADEMFDALMALPMRQRVALVLRFYEDLPEAEIAAVLRCREGTVASL